MHTPDGHEQPGQPVPEQPPLIGQPQQPGGPRNRHHHEHEQPDRGRDPEGKPERAGLLVRSEVEQQLVRDQQRQSGDRGSLVPQVHPVQPTEPRLQHPGAGRGQQRAAQQIHRPDTGDLAPEVGAGQPTRPLPDPHLTQHRRTGDDREPAHVAAFQPRIDRAAQHPQPVQQRRHDGHDWPPRSAGSPPADRQAMRWAGGAWSPVRTRRRGRPHRSGAGDRTTADRATSSRHSHHVELRTGLHAMPRCLELQGSVRGVGSRTGEKAGDDGAQHTRAAPPARVSAAQHRYPRTGRSPELRNAGTSHAADRRVDADQVCRFGIGCRDDLAALARGRI